MDEVTIEEVTKTEKSESESPDSPSFWSKLEAIVQNVIAKARPPWMDEESEEEDESEEDEEMDEKGGGKTDSPRKRKNPKMQSRKDNETTEKGVTETVSETTDVVTKAIEDRLAELEKAQKAQVEAVEKALEEKYKGTIEALAKQAEDAKMEVAKATEAREKREWLEKAGEMSLALPVKRDEMAEHLYAISKAAPEHIEWLTSLLKTADHDLTQAGLFNEFGTSRAAEEVEAVEKAEKIAKEKGVPLAEALLELSPAEQAEIVKGFLKEDK